MLYIYTSFYRQASSTLLHFGLKPLAVAFQMSSIFGEATFTSKTDPDHFEINISSLDPDQAQQNVRQFGPRSYNCCFVINQVISY